MPIVAVTIAALRLNETVDASLETDPEQAAVGENVTVTVNETIGSVETVTWTVDGQERIGVSTGSDSTAENRSPGKSVANETGSHELEVRVTEPDDFDVTAEIIGADGSGDVVSTTVPVVEPERTIGFELPERTATHTPFTATVSHDVERGNVSIEQYEWLLLDDEGELVTVERTTEPTAEFTVEEVSQYTLELEIRDEFGLTETATTTLEADSVPSWVTVDEPRFEIEAVEAPSAVEPGRTIPLEVSTTNVGEASGSADVTVEADGDTLADETLELGVGETEAITLSPAAPDRVGNHTLTVATDHERRPVSYAVRENPESSAAVAASRLESDPNGSGAGDEPRELDLLPTPSTAADIEPPSLSRDRLRTVLLGGATVAILGGFGLVGYALYTRPDRGPVTTAGSTESSDPP